MANIIVNHIHIYKGSLTVGKADGIQLSEGDLSVPLVVGPLNIATSEVSAPLPLAVRCDPAMYVNGVTVLSLIGTNSNLWALAPDVNGAPGTFLSYGAALTLLDSVRDTNTLFWIKAMAVTTDLPSRDTTVNLNITANVYGN